MSGETEKTHEIPVILSDGRPRLETGSAVYEAGTLNYPIVTFVNPSLRSHVLREGMRRTYVSVGNTVAYVA